MAKMSCLGFLLVAVVFGFAESHFFPPPHGPFGPHGPHRPMLSAGMPIFPPMVFKGPIIKKPIFFRPPHFFPAPVPVLQKVPVIKPVPFVKRVPVIQNVPVLRPYPVFRQIVVPRPVMVPVVREVQVPKPVPRPVPVPYPVPFQVQDQGVRIAQGPGAVAGGARTPDIIVSDADHVNMATSVIMDSQASNIIISDADHVTLDNQSGGSSVSVGSHAAGGANLANTGGINSGVDLSGLAGNNFVSGPGTGNAFNFAGGNTIVQGQPGQQNGGAFVGSPLAVISFDASNGLPDGAFSANFVDFGIGHGNNGGVGIDLAGHNIGGSQGGIGIELNGGGQQGIGGGHNGVNVDLAGHNIAGGHGGNGVDVGGQIDIGHGVGSKPGGNTVVDIHVGGAKQHSRNNHANQVVPV